MQPIAEIRVPTDAQRRNIEHVALCAGSSSQIRVTQGSTLELRSTDGSLQLEGLNTICRFVAGLGSKKAQLLGEDDTAKSQISEWLSYRNTELSPITEENLNLVNKHLLTRTYFLGSHLSLADLCLFSALHRPLANLPVSQVQRFSSLFRWYDHLQHTTGATAIYPTVSFPKTELPAVPAAPIPKANDAPKHKGAVGQKLPEVSKAPKVAGETAFADAARAPQIGQAAESSSGTPPSQPITPAPKSEPKAVDGPLDPKQAKKNARKEALKKTEAAKKQEEDVRVDMLDIRVGQITSIQDHPNAEALYVEQIDFGDGNAKQVVSGLRKFVSKDQMMGRKVVVCTNLKPAKMRDVMSYGMVLCASTQSHDKVDPLKPPPDAALGEKITISGYTNEPLEEINPKKKILEKLKEDLVTDSIGVATYKSNPFMCASGPVTSSFPNAFVG